MKGYEYDAYGNTIEKGDAQFKNSTKFTGAVQDKGTGLYYMNARHYNPSTGRFLQQDTYSGNPSQPWTQNLYTYCGNNPVNMIDPTGHSFSSFFSALGSIVKMLQTTISIIRKVGNISKGIVSKVAKAAATVQRIVSNVCNAFGPKGRLSKVVEKHYGKKEGEDFDVAHDGTKHRYIVTFKNEDFRYNEIMIPEENEKMQAFHLISRKVPGNDDTIAPGVDNEIHNNSWDDASFLLDAYKAVNGKDHSLSQGQISDEIQFHMDAYKFGILRHSSKNPDIGKRGLSDDWDGTALDIVTVVRKILCPASAIFPMY